CWRTTWNGTCGGRGGRCSLKTRRWIGVDWGEIRGPRGSRRPRGGGRKRSIKPPGGGPGAAFWHLLPTLGGGRGETIQVASAPSGTTFDRLSELDPVQAEALRLLEA